MMKTTLFITAAALTGAAQPTAEQTILPIPDAKVVAQIAYLEISQGADGFEFSLGEDTAVFIDLEFPGDHHIRIGF